MNTRHAAVWIDHHEAKIFFIESGTAETLRPHRDIERSRGKEDHSNPAEAEHYFEKIAKEVEGSQEILVVGPGSAKLEFIKHVHRRDRALVDKIVGVETVDHPTDGQLVAYARKYFHAKDRLL